MFFLELVCFNFRKNMNLLSRIQVSQIFKITGVAAIGCISCKFIYTFYWNAQEKRALHKIREKRKSERAEHFSQIKSTLPQDISSKKVQEFQEIVRLPLKALQAKLFKRELLAEQVLQACIWKSLQVQDDFNCITEFISGTMDKARNLDKMSMVLGPLHGIPFCVKEDTAIAGYDCSMGCTRRLGYPEKETAILVQLLEGLGGIAFCRTNLPQTCVSFGSRNPIFGKTLNPLNKHLSPGGSSSGTACLVAGGGCPFGTGSDTGGSLRLPAHFCGLSTLKPTSSRLSRKGVTRCSDILPGVPGIISKSPEDQALIFQALTDHNLQNKSDGSTVPISWNNQVFESKQTLRIGYITGLPIFPPIGDTQFLIDRVKSFLESAGHVLVPFDLPVPPTAFLDLPIDTNIGQKFHNLLQNDEISDSIIDLVTTIRGQSTWWCQLKEAIMKTSTPKNCNPPPTKEDLIHTFLSKMDQDNIDIIICPVFPFPSICVEDVPMFEGLIAYTVMWSWLDFVVGVVKFWTESGLHWNSSIDKMLSSSSGIGKREVWRKVLLKDGPNCVGMPIGCQVVGRPFQEELVLKIMVELDDINK